MRRVAAGLDAESASLKAKLESTLVELADARREKNGGEDTESGEGTNGEDEIGEDTGARR